MSRPVYSAQFVVYTPETPNASFLVPAGFTAVVRDGTVCQNIGDYVWTLSFQNSEEAPSCIFHQSTGYGVDESGDWQGRVVVPSGGIISVGVDSLGSAVSLYLGGYLLAA